MTPSPATSAVVVDQHSNAQSAAKVQQLQVQTAATLPATTDSSVIEPAQPRLTIFTIPKPFHGHIGIIQRNAIQSWIRLELPCEIILCGDEPGTAEVAAELNLHHLPDLPRNEFGTPFLHETFNQVQAVARGELLCYVNCDLIFLDDFSRAIQRIDRDPFLLVGRRWDFDQTELIDFGDGSWRQSLMRRVERCAKPHSLWGLDYFIFPRRGVLESMPPFVVGRPGWDNWMIYNARKRGIPVIDASPSIRAIHQNHDYSHVPMRKGERWVGPEAERQIRMITELMNGATVRFAIVDATHRLDDRGISRIRTVQSMRRRFDTLPALHPRAKPLITLLTPALRLADWMWQRMRGISRED